MLSGLDRRQVLLGAGLITLALPAGASAQQSDELAVQVDARKDGASLVHHWSKCVGAGRANEGLRADWLEQLVMVHQACGFEYCRFHGVFHDDMFVYREVDGRPQYNWQYVDALFDRMLDIGVRPFVEFGFMPRDLASGEATQFWWKGNVTPPKDYARWSDLVSAAVRHWIDRYGLDEVRRWYFEIWNEPNLRGFWAGTRSQYFELYRVSALAIKQIDPALRVGGPATSNFVGDDRFAGEVEDKSKQQTNRAADLNALPWHGVWIKAFLEYARANGLPVDFISTHPYPTDFALNPESGRNRGRTRAIEATRHDLEWLRRTIDRSAFPAAEIHLTEWSSSPSSRDFTHDYLQAAAFIVKANLDVAGLANSLSYWTFTDIFEEAGAGAAPFHGGFGLVNFQGVAKPTFHAYRMLNALGDVVLAKRDGLVVTRHSASGRITALAYNFPADVTDSLSFGDEAQAEQMLQRGANRDFALDLTGVAPNARFLFDQLDKHHGDVFHVWKTIGSPNAPDRTQTRVLKEAGLATARSEISADARGRLSWRGELTPWSCLLIDQL